MRTAYPTIYYINKTYKLSTYFNIYVVCTHSQVNFDNNNNNNGDVNSKLRHMAYHDNNSNIMIKRLFPTLP